MANEHSARERMGNYVDGLSRPIRGLLGVVIVFIVAGGVGAAALWGLPPILGWLDDYAGWIQVVAALIQITVSLFALFLVVFGVRPLFQTNPVDPQMVTTPLADTPKPMTTPEAKIAPGIEEHPDDDSQPSRVNWESRDLELLTDYLKQCEARYPDIFANLHGIEARVREHMQTSGLACGGPDGKVYLTHAGVLLCCQAGQIPKDTFHVQAKIRWESDTQETINTIGPVLLLYKVLHEALMPLVGQPIGSAETRDPDGGETIFF